MLLHLCVILFTGVLASQQASQVTRPASGGGVCIQGGRGSASREGGGSASMEGEQSAFRGRGICIQGEVGLHPGREGVCIWEGAEGSASRGHWGVGRPPSPI